ncbi:MAG: hypothetical protein AAGI44_16345 [Pseudomonadota bacterium]
MLSVLAWIHYPRTTLDTCIKSTSAAGKRRQTRDRTLLHHSSSLITALAISSASLTLIGVSLPTVAENLPPAEFTCEEIEDGRYMRCDVIGSGVLDVNRLPNYPWDGGPVIATAYGSIGGGGPGKRGPGSGGVARTVLEATQLSTLYIYSRWFNGGNHGGGAAAVMSMSPIETVNVLDELYLIAGGGGGEGILYYDEFSECGGGTGGVGGVADAAVADIDDPATPPISVQARGGVPGSGNVNGLTCHKKKYKGHQPTGGHGGIGGAQPGDSRSGGRHGYGGHGGPGAGTSTQHTNWIDADENPVLEQYSAGRGGTTSAFAGGGGGFGGGGGGERNYGGAGGGSYATAPTASPLDPSLLTQLRPDVGHISLMYPTDPSQAWPINVEQSSTENNKLIDGRLAFTSGSGLISTGADGLPILGKTVILEYKDQLQSDDIGVRLTISELSLELRPDGSVAVTSYEVNMEEYYVALTREAEITDVTVAFSEDDNQWQFTLWDSDGVRAELVFGD